MEQQQQQQEAHLKCPRCDSSNTKFCYYNNYSLSQPRHLCKACRRYWTRGGTLRSVPVGGKSRENKRVKQTSTTTTSSSTAQDPISSKPTTVKSSLSSSITTTHMIVNPLYSKRDGKDLSLPLIQFSKSGELRFSKSQNLSHHHQKLNIPAGDDANISNQVFSATYPFYGVNSASTSSTLMASSIIVPSSLESQNQVVFNGFKESSAENLAYGFLGPDDVNDQWLIRNGEGNQQQLVKENSAKMDGIGNRFDWKTNANHNYIEAMNMNFTSDPHPFVWSSSPPCSCSCSSSCSSSCWLYSTDIGSSVPFLI